MLFGETEASNPSRHMSESFDVGLKREEKEKKEGGGKCICVTSAQNKALYPFPELISNNQPSNLFPNIAGVSLQVVKLILAALSAFHREIAEHSRSSNHFLEDKNHLLISRKLSCLRLIVLSRN